MNKKYLFQNKKLSKFICPTENALLSWLSLQKTIWLFGCITNNKPWAFCRLLSLYRKPASWLVKKKKNTREPEGGIYKPNGDLEKNNSRFHSLMWRHAILAEGSRSVFEVRFPKRQQHDNDFSAYLFFSLSLPTCCSCDCYHRFYC